MSSSAHQQIRRFYLALARAWGPQHWWPAETRFEVILGAYLTQNTAWTNVERALENLKRAGVLSLSALRQISLAELEQLIRPAGYFRQKAQRIKTFIAFLDAGYHGSLDLMFAQPTPTLRVELLALNGIGPETADSILLYAGDHPVFVIDAYARRILARHGISACDADYERLRGLFEAALASDDLDEPVSAAASAASSGGRGAAHLPSPVSGSERTALARRFNQMHAFIVGLGKRHCFKAAPECDGCPLQPFLTSLPAAPRQARISRPKTGNKAGHTV